MFPIWSHFPVWGETLGQAPVKGARGGRWDHGLVAHIQYILGVAGMTCGGVGLGGAGE